MQKDALAHTAQIIPFPRRTTSVVGTRHLQLAPDRLIANVVDTDGWYHEAAIVAERRDGSLPLKCH